MSGAAAATAAPDAAASCCSGRRIQARTRRRCRSDQHPVGDLGPDRQDEAFSEAVRPRTPRRDLDHRDASVRHDRVERLRELTGPIADEEPKPRNLLAEIHHEVAGLLGGPRPIGMPGHTQHVQVPVADLEHEQDVEPPQRERAVDVEEVDREHAGRLRAQELSPAGVGVPDRRWWEAVALQDPPDRRSSWHPRGGRV
jgi:hypothetical protein